MNERKALLIAALAWLGAALPAAAQDADWSLGVMYLFNVDVELPGAESVRFSDNNGYGLVGRWRFAPGWSLEAGALELGAVRSEELIGVADVGTEHAGHSYLFGLRGGRNVWDLFELWFSAGVQRWENRFNFEMRYVFDPGVVRSGSADASGTDPYLRLGASTRLFGDWHVSLEIGQLRMADFFGDLDGDAAADLDQRIIGVTLENRF